MSKEMLIALVIGCGAMLIPISLVGRLYKISLMKSCVLSVIVTIVGTIGTKIMFFIENGYFDGYSYYGGVFLVLIFSIAFYRVLKVPMKQLLDCYAPAGCAMVSFMKMRCLATGCCGGRVFYMSGTQKAIQFPSQIIELCVGLILMVIVLLLLYKGKRYGELFPWFMVFYGISRFILNYFRGDQSLFILGMTPGHFWSIISVLIGVIWLFINLEKESETVYGRCGS